MVKNQVSTFLSLILIVQGAFTLNPLPDCGRSFYTNNIESKIIGGVDAVPHSWPSIVALFKKDTTEWSHFCGGTLIDNKTVLTAAHCLGSISRPTFESTNPDDLRVYLGLHNKQKVDADGSVEAPGKYSAVSKVVMHQEYNDNNWENDIAVLILKNEIELTNEIQTACLPSKDSKIAFNTSVYIAGWGSIQNYSAIGDRPDPEYPSFLQNVKIKILRTSDCESSSFGGGQITEGLQICAGDLNGNKDTCQGDSGGPLYDTDSNMKHIVEGVVSYGMNGCGSVGIPQGVYTRVSGYIDWIYENTNGDIVDNNVKGLLAELIQLIKSIIEAILSALNPFN